MNGEFPTSETAISRFVTSRHEPFLTDIESAATAVTESWECDWVDDPSAIVDPLGCELDRRNVIDRCPRVIEDVLSELGSRPFAPIVAAPPYVVVTSRGPMLRATLDECRIILLIRVFSVDTGGPVRYERTKELDLDVRFNR